MDALPMDLNNQLQLYFSRGTAAPPRMYLMLY